MVLSLFGNSIKGFFLGQIVPFAHRDRPVESLLFVHIQGEKGTNLCL